jgi:hypothetical protein
MASWAGGAKLVQVVGESAALVDRLREPLLQALSGRRCRYAVRVDTVGPMGEVLVSITGSQGRTPLLFGRGELEAGHVSRVVQGAVDKPAVQTPSRGAASRQPLGVGHD